MPDQTDKRLVKELQIEIPICSRPYDIIANRIGISEKEVMESIGDMINDGKIRRFGAILNHKKVGFNSNAMVVWKVEKERIQEVGRLMASCNAVSHCYQRAELPDWPYNIFTMIHETSRQKCQAIIRELSQICRVAEYEILYSLNEFKKTSMQYE